MSNFACYPFKKNIRQRTCPDAYFDHVMTIETFQLSGAHYLTVGFRET